MAYACVDSLDPTIVAGQPNHLNDHSCIHEALQLIKTVIPAASSLSPNVVNSAAIQALAVTAAKIAANTITAAEIAANAIGSSELADNAVDTAAIAASAVTVAKLASVPMCRVHRTADQTAIAINTSTAITFPTGSATEQFDSDAFHDLTTNPSRMTIPAALDGLYLIRGRVAWIFNAGGLRELKIKLNATTAGNGTELAITKIAPSPTEGTIMEVATIYRLSAGDWVDMWARHSATVTLDLANGRAATSLELVRLSAL